MRTKKSMADLAGDLGEPIKNISEIRLSENKKNESPSRRNKATVTLDRTQEVYGNKADFIKFTCTLDPLTYKWLMNESINRKTKGEKNMSPSVVIREALVAKMKGKA
jgi:hypothetical protein